MEKELGGRMEAHGVWDPHAYIVEGRYCPPDAISDRLEDLRSAIGATELALISHDGWVPFRTLSYTTQLTATGRSARQQLNAAVNSAEMPRITFPNATGTSSDWESAVAMLAGTPSFSWLSTGPSPWRYLRAASAHPPNGLGVILVALDLGSPCEMSVSDLQARANELQLMVNASAISGMHRDRRVTQQIDRIQIADMRAARRPKGIRGLLELLTTARAVLDVDAIAYYRYGAVDTLRLSEWVSAPGSTLRPRARRAARSTVDVAGQTRQVVVYSPPWLTAMHARSVERLTPTWSFARGTSRIPFEEHAIPVRAAPLGDLQADWGVLSIAKHTGNSTPSLGAYQIALARNLSLRIALWEFVSQFTNTLTTVRDVTKATTRQPPLRSGGGRSFPYRDQIPGDLRDLLPTVELLLDEVRQSLNASTVTVRLLLPIGPGARLHLVRAAASPRSAMRDPHPVIELSHAKSMHAAVARTGRAISEWNIQNPAKPAETPFIAARKGTKSAMCVPIYEVGLIGTMNLESRTHHRFDYALAAGQAFAEQIAVAIGYSRAKVAASVLDFADNAARNAHTALQITDSIDELLGEFRGNATIAPKLTELNAALVQTITAPLAAMDGALGTGGASSVIRQIYDACEHLGIDDQIDLDAVDSQLTLPPRARPLVGAALLDVFGNVSRYRRKWPGDRISVRIDTCEINGGPIAVVEIAYRHGQTLAIETRVRLFRIPVEERRPHVGSYSAGAMLRSIGGDIYATTADDMYMRIAIRLPIYRRNEGRGAHES